MWYDPQGAAGLHPGNKMGKGSPTTSCRPSEAVSPAAAQVPLAVSSGILTVTLHKPDTNARLGLTLTSSGDSGVDGCGPLSPTITALVPGLIASKCKQLRVGQTLVSVNGVRVDGHKHATNVLKAASGNLVLKLLEVPQQLAPPHMQPARPAQPIEPPPKVPPPKAVPPPAAPSEMKRYEMVRLYKPDKETKLGLTLTGSSEASSNGSGSPLVTGLTPGKVAAESKRLRVGQRLVAVNGVRVDGHEHATNLLKSASGELVLKLLTPWQGAAQEPRTAQAPHHAKVPESTSAPAHKGAGGNAPAGGKGGHGKDEHKKENHPKAEGKGKGAKGGKGSAKLVQGAPTQTQHQTKEDLFKEQRAAAVVAAAATGTGKREQKAPGADAHTSATDRGAKGGAAEPSLATRALSAARNRLKAIQEQLKALDEEIARLQASPSESRDQLVATLNRKRDVCHEMTEASRMITECTEMVRRSRAAEKNA